MNYKFNAGGVGIKVIKVFKDFGVIRGLRKKNGRPNSGRPFLGIDNVNFRDVPSRL